MHMDTKVNDLAATLRSMVEHETSQIDRRLTWLSQLQGFLFASLGFAWDKGNHLVTILSVLGIMLALLVGFSVIISMAACERIRKCWVRLRPSDYDGPDIFGFYPHHAPATVYVSVEILIPVVIALGWVTVLFVR